MNALTTLLLTAALAASAPAFAQKLHGTRRQAARRAREAAVLAERDVGGPRHDGRRRNSADPRGPRRDGSRGKAALTPTKKTRSTADGSGSAWRSATSPTSSRRTSATATSRSACCATCPSMPGLVAGLQRLGPTREPIRIGMLWLDAHPDFNTPETTRSGSLGGMPVAVATGRALQRMRLDAQARSAAGRSHVVMGGVRLTDPLEQELLDDSRIEQLSVDDLRNATPAVFAQLDRLNRLTDKIYVHIDMDVLDPREVMGHGNKVPNGPSSEQLAALFEPIFTPLSEGVRDRLRDDPADRRGRALDRGREPHDRRRRARRAGARGALTSSSSIASRPLPRYVQGARTLGRRVLARGPGYSPAEMRCESLRRAGSAWGGRTTNRSARRVLRAGRGGIRELDHPARRPAAESCGRSSTSAGVGVRDVPRPPGGTILGDDPVSVHAWTLGTTGG